MIIEPKDLKEMLAPKARLFGLDIGEKTIGLGLSDTRLTIASPYETIRRKKFTTDARDLLSKAEKEGVGGFLLGLPVNMNGTEGPKCQSVRQFAKNLEEKTDLPITFWDERLSTVAVMRTLLEANASRKRQKELVDKMAASYILQGFLDWMQNQ